MCLLAMVEKGRLHRFLLPRQSVDTDPHHMSIFEIDSFIVVTRSPLLGRRGNLRQFEKRMLLRASYFFTIESTILKRFSARTE